MKNRTRAAALAKSAAVLLTATLALTACGGTGASTETAQGGVLRIGTTTDVVQFAPLNNVSISDQYIMNQLYPDLFTLEIDGTLSPHLAESYTVSDDGMVIDIVLSDEFSWSDGEPITADDVKFTLDRFVSDKLLHGITIASNLASAEVTSPTELSVTMKSASYGWAQDLARSMKVLPMHVFADVPNLAEYPIDAHEDAWVSGGSFTLTGITKGQSYTFERNEGYPLSADGNEAVEGVEFRIYPDLNTMQLALQSGDLDLAAPSIPSSAVTSLASQPNIEVVETTEALNYSKLTFNASSAPLDDVVVRQVISGLIDTDAILTSVLQDRGTHPVGPVLPVYTDYQPDIEEWSFTADEARTMMTDAGYTDADGDDYFDGIDLKLLCDQGNANHAKSAQIVRDNLATAGITVSLACSERATSLAAAKTGDFDLYIHKLNQINSPATSLALQYSSANTSGLYYNYVVDAEMDSLIATAAAATTEADNIADTQAAAAYIHENAYVLPLYVEALSNAYNSSRFTGYLPSGSETFSMVNPYSLSQVVPAT
ncbi:ABC transporter substrate-binding protein [Cryobacterium melibiosiphilum]|uniref:ABC transporter substrate-binding protein n=1 Tax=Cryobacterium melibiosiphilum TaxID=995039 RepID=A0A3A5MUU2_9MICO|nr:ABC transporter substrate-binding protein [Cryobacterium melibiosiphilum]RJT88974.1 ABC transporter substrate-binding protein [Cryobacterium melibiosiphilum]